MWNRLAVAALLVTSALFFMSNANAQKGRNVEVSPAGAVDIKVDDGEFQFRNLHVNYPKLSGVLINSTKKMWTELEFNVQMWDANGKSSGFFIVDVANLMPGEIRLVSDSTLSDNKSFSKLTAFYHFGKYPVDYNFVMTKPVKSDSLTFQDSNIEIKFAISRTSFTFALANKTDEGIGIDWEQASFIDTEGKMHKALYGGKTASFDGPSVQGPRLIPPGARLEVMEFPGDWSLKDALQGCKTDWEALFPAGDEAKVFAGKTVSFFLPLHVKDVTKSYLFSFNIQIQ
jgi:hypothetical protein